MIFILEVQQIWTFYDPLSSIGLTNRAVFLTPYDMISQI